MVYLYDHWRINVIDMLLINLKKDFILEDELKPINDLCFFTLCEMLEDDFSVHLENYFPATTDIDVIKTDVVIINQNKVAAIMKGASVSRNPYKIWWNINDIAVFIECLSKNTFVIPEEQRDFTVVIDNPFFISSNDKLIKYINSLKLQSKEFIKSPCEENNFDELHKFGLEYLNNDQWNYAIDLFLKANTLKPYNEKIKFDIGLCYMYQWKFDEAIKYFVEIIAKNPNEEESKVLLGKCYEYLQLPTEAYILFKSVKDKKLLADYEVETEYLLKSGYYNNIEIVNDVEVVKFYCAIPFTNMPLPEVINSNGKQRYIDPVRSISVSVTKEETIRQQVLYYLINKCNIPQKCIVSEDNLKHYDKSLMLRADITVKVNGKTILLVECKEPNVVIEGEPVRQIFNYNKTLNSKFLMITNGDNTFVFYENLGKYETLMNLPSFNDMCNKKDFGESVAEKVVTQRPTKETLNNKDIIKAYKCSGLMVGENTKDELTPFILDLSYALLDESYSLVTSYRKFNCKIISDYKTIYMSVGNASGGKYLGNFRKLIVKYNDTEDYNLFFKIAGTGTDENRVGGYSSLVCAIEEKGKPVSRLQINLDRYLKKYKTGFSLYHDGRAGSGKNKDIINYVSQNCSELIENGEVYLGWLDNSDIITLSDKNGLDLMLRLSSYLILRSRLKNQ